MVGGREGGRERVHNYPTFSLSSMATKLVNCDTMEYSLLMLMM